MSRRSSCAMAAAIATTAAACRSEFLIARFDETTSTGSSTSSGATLETSTNVGDATLVTATGTSETDASSSSTGSECADDTGTGSETTGAPPECEAPMGHTVCDGSDDDLFHALGLACNGGMQETTPITNATITADPQSARVGTRYGSDNNEHWVPTEGSKIVVLSTGILDLVSGRIEVPLGRAWADDGDNANPDGTLPSPVVPSSGSGDGPCAGPFVDCDGVGDCSDSLPDVWNEGGAVAHDLAWLRFDVVVPAGTFGYRVDLAWFTAEFPEKSADAASDLLVWWQSSEAFTGNVATLDGAPLSVAGVGEAIASEGFVGFAPELDGTGYESTEVGGCDTPWGDYPAGQCPNGGSTTWLTLHGRVNPGETVTMVAAVLDVGDADVDSAVVLDRWRWSCEGCTPGVDCGLGPLSTQ